jgi:hypothetical protein
MSRPAVLAAMNNVKRSTFPRLAGWPLGCVTTGLRRFALQDMLNKWIATALAGKT